MSLRRIDGYYCLNQNYKGMKLDALNTIVALLLSALLAYGCYALCKIDDLRLLITIASFIQLSITGIGAFAVKLPDERKTMMFGLASKIFFVIVAALNLVAIFISLTIPFYIILSGILLLAYILAAGFVARAEQA